MRLFGILNQKGWKLGRELQLCTVQHFTDAFNEKKFMLDIPELSK